MYESNSQHPSVYPDEQLIEAGLFQVCCGAVKGAQVVAGHASWSFGQVYYGQPRRGPQLEAGVRRRAHEGTLQQFGSLANPFLSTKTSSSPLNQRLQLTASNPLVVTPPDAGVFFVA